MRTNLFNQGEAIVQDSIHDIIRRSIRGTEYTFTTLLFSDNLVSKILVLTHALLVLLVFACVWSVVKAIFKLPNPIDSLPTVCNRIERIFHPESCMDLLQMTFQAYYLMHQ